ncbi:MAG: YdcF family protein [Clostridia bacterium]|nr:YdcF family protein [Clostridia bacterium]
MKFLKNTSDRISKHKRIIIASVAILLEIAILAVLGVLIISAAVNTRGSQKIVTEEQAASITDADCILVLGAGVRSDGSPSDMLRDRLTVGVALYKAGVAKKILMSGDHMHGGYDEVNAMKSFATEQGVPSKDVFMDHAGISTYDSIWRAKNIFCVDSIVIVTQEYHLPRAIYIAEQLNIKAVGVSASLNTYSGQPARNIRELAARAKDFAYTYLGITAKFKGDTIPISSTADGNVTND